MLIAIQTACFNNECFESLQARWNCRDHRNKAAGKLGMARSIDFMPIKFLKIAFTRVELLFPGSSASADN